MSNRKNLFSFFAAPLTALVLMLGLLPAVSVWAQETAPAAEAPAADASAEKVEVANPFGLENMIEEGGPVSIGTLVILVIMSMGSWYIMFTKIYEQSKMNKQAKEAAAFWGAGSVNQGLDTLKSGSPFHYIASQAIDATKHHGGLYEHIDLNDWVSLSIQRAIDNVKSRTQDGLSFLATVGSTSPFVGLFGTVWGIVKALIKIGVTGQASIDKVAGPVGEALIMTAIGLFVAVPAVLGYNWLVSRNKTVMEGVRNFGADLHSVLLSNSKAK